ncbi:MAG: hypothetical protein ABIQ40_06445 [Bacteroidia bacterium]
MLPYAQYGIRRIFKGINYANGENPEILNILWDNIKFTINPIILIRNYSSHSFRRSGSYMSS